MDLDLLIAQIPLFVLNVIRAVAFFSTAPLFGVQRESRLLRVILGLCLGSIFWYVGTDWTRQMILPLAAANLLELAVLAGREVVVGMAAGFSLHAIVSILGIAGEIISHEMGFAMSRVLNPVTGNQSTAMAQFFEVMAYLLIFQLNMHHEFVYALQGAYEYLPVGSPIPIAAMWANLQVMMAESIDFGLRYAIPIFGVMLLLTVTLVILARAVPNINLLEFSFGLRILLAMFASIYFLGEGQPFLVETFEYVFANARTLFLAR